MPGVRRGIFGWDWIGEPPLCWKIIFGVTIVQLVTGFILDATLPRWAQSTPDPQHPIEVHSHYLSPLLGWFVNNDLWIFFAMFGILALTMFLHRDKIQRIR
jgi:dipeptide/tripeptide permease